MLAIHLLEKNIKNIIKHVSSKKTGRENVPSHPLCKTASLQHLSGCGDVSYTKCLREKKGRIIKISDYPNIEMISVERCRIAA